MLDSCLLVCTAGKTYRFLDLYFYIYNPHILNIVLLISFIILSMIAYNISVEVFLSNTMREGSRSWLAKGPLMHFNKDLPIIIMFFDVTFLCNMLRIAH